LNGNAEQIDRRSSSLYRHMYILEYRDRGEIERATG
jgi:hypothetical protein